MGSVVHYEITATDTARAKKFYEEALGRKIENANMPRTDYWLTIPKGNGIDGAIMPKEYNPQPVIPHVSVTDIDESIEKVKKAGGSIVNEKMNVPGVGYSIYIKDSEGNVIGLLQELEEYKKRND